MIESNGILKKEFEMDAFVTVATFTYPIELAVIKGRLESDGIDCLVKDELTVQVYGLYSNAIGGIKLQVKEADIPRAKKLLIEGGYIKEEQNPSVNFWVSMGRITRKVPFLNKVRPELRFIILSGVLCFSLVWLVFKATTPSTLEYLTKYSWCLERLVYEGNEFVPNSIGLKLFAMGSCKEHIRFRANGSVDFPGFNSQMFSGQWTLNEGLLDVLQVENYPQVFMGEYKIDINGNTMILVSETTTIYCKRGGY